MGVRGGMCGGEGWNVVVRGGVRGMWGVGCVGVEGVLFHPLKVVLAINGVHVKSVGPLACLCVHATTIVDTLQQALACLCAFCDLFGPSFRPAPWATPTTTPLGHS